MLHYKSYTHDYFLYYKNTNLFETNIFNMINCNCRAKGKENVCNSHKINVDFFRDDGNIEFADQLGKPSCFCWHCHGGNEWEPNRDYNEDFVPRIPQVFIIFQKPEGLFSFLENFVTVITIINSCHPIVSYLIQLVYSI